MAKTKEQISSAAQKFGNAAMTKASLYPRPWSLSSKVVIGEERAG